MKRFVRYIIMVSMAMIFVACPADGPEPEWHYMYWNIENNTDKEIYVLKHLAYVTYLQASINYGHSAVKKMAPNDRLQIYQDAGHVYSDESKGFERMFDDDMWWIVETVKSYPEYLSVDDWSLWVATTPDGEAVKRWRYGDREQEERNFFNESSWECDESSGVYIWTFHILPEDLEEVE